MSRQFIVRRVTCGNDCRQQGCPSHDLKLIYEHTSDTVAITLDDEHYATFDHVHWRALVNMDDELRNRR